MSAYKRLGITLACVNAGIPPEDFDMHKSATEFRENPETPGYGAVERVVADIAARLYEGCGKQRELAYHVYDSLSKKADWNPAYNRFIDPVLEVLGESLQEALLQQAEHDEEFKSAAIQTGAIGRMAGKALTWSPSMLQTLLGLSMATGAGAGSLWWYLNQNANQDDEQTASMQAKIDHYNKLTQEISEHLKNQ